MTDQFHSLSRRAVMAGALALAGAARAAGAPDPAYPTGDIHDFDFFVGHWHLANRRLKKHFVGSEDWEAFPATLRCEGHLGGIVNIDDAEFPTLGSSGMTVRLFNLEKRQWAIYWISSRNGELQAPVFGGFSGDRGEFYGDDIDDGRPIKARYIWSRLGPDAAHWEQAFSLDGKEWETNWIVDHTRIRA